MRINIGTNILRWFDSLINKHPDVIVFYPNKEAFCYSIESIKKGKNTPYDPSFYYELVNILNPQEGLWKRWKNRPNSTFDENGKFHGGRANPPWLWREGYGRVPESSMLGEMWDNPAKLVSESFRPGRNRRLFSLKYIRKMDGTRYKK